MMSILARLARKSALSDADIERLVNAVVAAQAGHAAEAPPAAQNSPRMQALLRSMQTPAPVASKPSAPSAAPAKPPVIRTRISPASIHRDRPDRLVHDCGPGIPPLTSVLQYGADGRIAGVAVGTLTFKVHRGADGRIAMLTNGDFVSRVKRDAAGKMTEIVTAGIPPNPWSERP